MPRRNYRWFGVKPTDIVVAPIQNDMPRNLFDFHRAVHSEGDLQYSAVLDAILSVGYPVSFQTEAKV